VPNPGPDDGTVVLLETAQNLLDVGAETSVRIGLTGFDIAGSLDGRDIRLAGVALGEMAYREKVLAGRDERCTVSVDMATPFLTGFRIAPAFRTKTHASPDSPHSPT
jgi:hypothetical protein